MAKRRDLLDDIIDIQEEIQAISSPLSSIANTLVGKPGTERVWNPDDYKERPRPQVSLCTSCRSQDPTTCRQCIDVCPVDAITIDGGKITLSQDCRQCGLCVAVCPSSAYQTRSLNAKSLYDRIVGASAGHEKCYVTCTRALQRLPFDNEVVLPCVGVVPSEVWFAVLAECDNVSVYLPLDICEECRTVTGEATYTDEIARGEEWADLGLGLEVDEAELDHSLRRAWQRQEFVENIVKSGERLISRTNPVLNAAQKISRRLADHRRQLDRMQQSLEKAVGTTNSQRKRRILTERRRALMGGLQELPEAASRIGLYEPVCDTSLCILCGLCEEVCPTRTISISNDERWSCEPSYCVQCGACTHVCPTQAIEYEYTDAVDLVIPDELAAEKARREAAQKAEMARLKEQGMAIFTKGLDFLQALDGPTSDADKVAD